MAVIAAATAEHEDGGRRDRGGAGDAGHDGVGEPHPDRAPAGFHFSTASGGVRYECYPPDSLTFNLKALGIRMGHANIGITLDRYGDLMPGNEDEAAKLLDDYLKRSDTSARLAQIPGS